MNPDSLLRAVAVGAATGSRSFLGLAALTLATPADADGQPDATLAKPWAKGVTSTMALGELVGDKLPQSPSRATWAPLGARLATASGVGALVGRRFGQRAATGDPVSPRPVTDDASQQRQQRSDMVICAALGAAAATGTTLLGPRVRAAVAHRFGHDWIGAVLEDAFAAALSFAAARPSATGPARHAAAPTPPVPG